MEKMHGEVYLDQSILTSFKELITFLIQVLALSIDRSCHLEG